jgi:hypothetical protein
VEALGAERLSRFFKTEYFGDNPDRDALNLPAGKFSAADVSKKLTTQNGDWLRRHPNLCPMETEEQIREEAKRRARALPDLAERIARARAAEPRYLKIIRALCERSGQKLDRVTAGDPTHMYRGSRLLAWHFITNLGHHHMVESGGKALMFRGPKEGECVCEIGLDG